MVVAKKKIKKNRSSPKKEQKKNIRLLMPYAYSELSIPELFHLIEKDYLNQNGGDANSANLPPWIHFT